MRFSGAAKSMAQAAGSTTVALGESVVHAGQSTFKRPPPRARAAGTALSARHLGVTVVQGPLLRRGGSSWIQSSAWIDDLA